MTTSEINAMLDDLLVSAQAEVKGVDLFAPPPPKEDCPICFLPLPLSAEEIVYMKCCGKICCCGCIYTNFMTIHQNGGLQHTCAFCRQQTDDEDFVKDINNQMRKGNPHAYICMAKAYEEGDAPACDKEMTGVIPCDRKSLEMFVRASDLGSADAFQAIANHYKVGKVVEKDASKQRAFLEISVKKGSVVGRLALGELEQEEGNAATAIRHLTIAASAGSQDSLNQLMQAYKDKLLTKEDLARTLHAFQAVNDGLQSKGRDNIRRLLDQQRLKHGVELNLVG